MGKGFFKQFEQKEPRHKRKLSKALRNKEKAESELARRKAEIETKKIKAEAKIFKEEQKRIHSEEKRIAKIHRQEKIASAKAKLKAFAQKDFKDFRKKKEEMK